MNLESQFKLINGLIYNGHLEEAREHLKSTLATNNAEKRTKGHLLATVTFREGKIDKAYEEMQTVLDQYGENVNLMRDILVCQYHLQDMQGFRSGLNRLEILLLENEHQLSTRSLIECELMVGKFLEEEARLAPAAVFYDRALNRAKEPRHRLRALIQKARWQALYEPTQELSNYYRELISFPREKLNMDLSVELEHSLILIELRLVGSDHAWQRIERVGHSVSEIDQRLLIFDFIEGILGLDVEPAPAVLKKAGEFKDLDPFENFLKQIVTGELDQQGLLAELTVLSSKLPWASYLRLLCVAANIEKNASVKSELHRKIQLILRALDPRSQVLWTQRLKQTLQTPEVRMDFSSRNRSLTIQGKVVDLSKKKTGLLLLERLVIKNTMTVDEAIELLWQSSFSPEHYHRLRMSIHRLNTLIHETVGIGKVIEVDAQTVRLRPEVRLRPVEDTFDFGLIGL
jgi:cell division inhibitor SulA